MKVWLIVVNCCLAMPNLRVLNMKCKQVMTQDEFEDNVMRMRCRAVSVARGCGLGCADADDVAQDTLLRLWTLRGDILSCSHAEALAVVVARRLVADRFRGRACEDIGELRDVADEGMAAPDAMLEAAETDGWLAGRLASLPSTEWQVLRMRQVEQRSRGEIARILGIAETSVSTLLARARRKLLDDIKRRNRL